jgi:hypothetical protein
VLARSWPSRRRLTVSPEAASPTATPTWAPGARLGAPRSCWPATDDGPISCPPGGVDPGPLRRMSAFAAGSRRSLTRQRSVSSAGVRAERCRGRRAIRARRKPARPPGGHGHPDRPAVHVHVRRGGDTHVPRLRDLLAAARVDELPAERQGLVLVARDPEIESDEDALAPELCRPVWRTALVVLDRPAPRRDAVGDDRCSGRIGRRHRPS